MTDYFPLISVILPVYNMAPTLAVAVDSILAQTYPYWELIIVDDGSTDSSGSLADAYMQKDNRILALHQKNGGVGAARNRALSCVNGEWLAFLDADDEYLPECFEQMIRVSSGADLVACGIYAEYDRVLCRPYDEVRVFNGFPDGKDLDILWANYIFPVVWAKLYRRPAVRDLFLTDISYGEDTLFNARVFPALGRIVVIPEAGYIYHKQRQRLDRGMLEGARVQLESVAAWLPENTVLRRRTFIAYIRSIRLFVLNILDSEELTSEKKAEELAFCDRMVRLPKELDHEEFLFPENLEWWRQLKDGQYKQATDGLRIIREKKRRRIDLLPSNAWILAPRG